MSLKMMVKKATIIAVLALFAMLLCTVAIAIAYDSFFNEKTKSNENSQVVKTDLNWFADFTLNFSNDAPMLYGAFAIILAVVLGALTAFVRKFLSDLRKKN